jgi:predicted transcriptional regulator
MKSTDYRDMTFQDLQAHLVDDRMRVYTALVVWGPCTTRQLAKFMAADILSVRPRVTELCQMGVAVEAEVSAEKRRADGAAREGYYEAIPLARVEEERKRERVHVIETQLQLGGV